MSEEKESYSMADLKVSVSYSFNEWLDKSGGTVVVSNMGGGLVFISCDQGKVSLLMRQFVRPMGLAVHGQQLIFGTEHEVHYFVNSPKLASTYPKAEEGRYDALYLPTKSYVTARINCHDIGLGEHALWICNTLYSCVCTPSDDASFDPRWHPKFISELVPEDRCHLNGLAIKDGYPKYVTCLAETDTHQGWRPHVNEGGLLIDTDTWEPVLRGLAMPHSPRWYNGRLYFMNSAAGEFCVADVKKGTHDVICCVPGMTRGLCFVGDYALVGLSLLRHKEYGKWPRRIVQDRFDKLICGVALVDLKAGKPIGLLQFTTVVGELYDTAFIPGVRRPMILTMNQREEVRVASHIGKYGWWLPDDDKKKFASNPGDQPAAPENPADPEAAPKK